MDMDIKDPAPSAVRKRSPRMSPAMTVALVGIMAATVECAKLALAALPNIEVVTLLLALYGYVFGMPGVLAGVVFVAIEPLIWGFNTWVLSYMLYWPFVPLAFAILARLRVMGRIIPAALAVIMTVWFGILTTLVDTGLLSGFFESFWSRFAVMYTRGIVFFAIQTACNAVLFVLLFPSLSHRLARLRDRMVR